MTVFNRSPIHNRITDPDERNRSTQFVDPVIGQDPATVILVPDGLATKVFLGPAQKVPTSEQFWVDREAMLHAQRLTRTHLWVVSIVYRIDDPETALDDMICDVENLLGARPIICLWCERPYNGVDDPGVICPANR